MSRICEDIVKIAWSENDAYQSLELQQAERRFGLRKKCRAQRRRTLERES